MILFCIGGMVGDPKTVPIYTAFLACFLGSPFVAVPLNLRRARRYQRQIDKLDNVRRKPE